MAPERRRPDRPPNNPWALLVALYRIPDGDIIEKCGLDAYFFLRHLRTQLVIFGPTSLIVLPTLLPINYIGGIGQSLRDSAANGTDTSTPTGLDTIAWGNIQPMHANRYWTHLVLAVLVISWVCYISYFELRTYTKVRQDYLTRAECRRHVSASTVLVSDIPAAWRSEGALRRLFGTVPGGIRNVWLIRDCTKLLDKIRQRDTAHEGLEAAETELIRKAAKRQMKQPKMRRNLRDTKGVAVPGASESPRTEDADCPVAARFLSWQRFPDKTLPSDEEKVLYPSAENPNYLGDDKEDEHAEWTKWLKKSDRPSHRPSAGSQALRWLPGLLLARDKVDSIYFYRKEVARLNLEIAQDQLHHEQYTPTATAFIQFQGQLAAHMACQSALYHIPRCMTPCAVGVPTQDVIWKNVAVRWWNAWLRTFVVLVAVSGMTILWAFPVALTSSLSQIDSLIQMNPWLHFVQENQVVYTVVKATAGVLPALLLSLLLSSVPALLDLLATFQGAKTGSEKAASVQAYYFFFLFVQVFLVVSIAGGAITTLQNTVEDVQGVPGTLAKNLPKSANYFFSYMLLQAMSTSSGSLLQINALIARYIVVRGANDTARRKWQRQVTLPSIYWGSVFPVYTNLTCIALVYTVIAPLISVVTTFSFVLLWVANRYNIIYVASTKVDTGGVLYPRAINQTFTGLYFMELCLIGLFFLVRNEHNEVACAPQAVIMSVVLASTVAYQIALNRSFGALLRFLPIATDDKPEASAAADNRFTVASTRAAKSATKRRQGIRRRRRSNVLTKHPNVSGLRDADANRCAQTRDAFQNPELRARPRTVWIPSDVKGVSDDEMRHTRHMSELIPISNEGASLDSKTRVFCIRKPPDMSGFEGATV